MLQVRAHPKDAGRGSLEVGECGMARQRAHRAQVSIQVRYLTRLQCYPHFASMAGRCVRSYDGQARQRFVQLVDLIGLAKDWKLRRRISRRFAVPGGQ